jgi:hypothetical protein
MSSNFCGGQIARPIDLTAHWHDQHFVDAGEPVLWPFAVALDGGEVWAQPMALEGERLELWIREGFELFFSTEETSCLVRFGLDKFQDTAPAVTRDDRESDASILPMSGLSRGREDTNGAAHS